MSVCITGCSVGDGATSPALRARRPADQTWLDHAMRSVGAVVGGRWTYEAADHWGGTNPWGIPFFIVTHRPEEQPDASAGFQFVAGLETAVDLARHHGWREHHPPGSGRWTRRPTNDTFIDYRVVNR